MYVQQRGAKLRSEVERPVNGWKQMWKVCLCKEGLLVSPLLCGVYHAAMTAAAAACAVSESLGFFVSNSSHHFGFFCCSKRTVQWPLYSVHLRIFTNSVQLVRQMQIKCWCNGSISIHSEGLLACMRCEFVISAEY